jgi:hypothetical protein
MKKSLFAIAAFVLIAISSSSCKKETVTKTVVVNDTVAVVYPVEGLWIGTSTDKNGVSSSYSSSFYADGTVLDKAIATVGGAVYYSGGTWTLSGNTITCTITAISPASAITQTQTFIYSNTGQLTSGTWTDISGASDSGTFTTMTPASK